MLPTSFPEHPQRSLGMRLTPYLKDSFQSFNALRLELSVTRRVERSCWVEHCLLGKVECLRYVVEFLSSIPVSTSMKVFRISCSL